METVVSTKGQVVIPKRLREQWGLARFYLNDDEEQAGRAARVLAEEDVFVLKTVLLKLEWVRRGEARISPADIARSLTHFLSLPNVRVEDEANVKVALKAFVRES
jgi:bifunctional DNA-binding transcriptional regulator/antitoxin component of YhaV-PrlF toxin-antitoxin module